MIQWWFMRYVTQRCRTLFTTDAVARCLSCKTTSGTIAAIGGAVVMIIGRVAKSSIVRDAFIIPKGVPDAPDHLRVQDYEIDTGLVMFRFFFFQMQRHTE